MKYSVLMSLYKKEKPEYLKLAIDSMINQTVKPDEIVIVEDGPLTQELYDVIDSYLEKYPNLFNIVKNETNIGLGLSLNKGLAACRNELVARMDTDDISKPDRCEKQLKVFKGNPNISICGTNIDEFNGTIDNITGQRRVPEKNEEIYKFSKRRSAFNHPTIMYKKYDVLKYNGYSDLRRNQDVDLFGRMIFGGCQAYNIQESLLYFRASDELAKRRKSWDNSKTYINTIKRFWKMGYSSFTDYFVVACAQTMMFICPVKVQNWLYKKFLRKRENKK